MWLAVKFEISFHWILSEEALEETILFKKRRILLQSKSLLKNRTETTKKQFLQLWEAATSTSAVKLPMKFRVDNYNIINHGKLSSQPTEERDT